jgi:hypothetical protein
VRVDETFQPAGEDRNGTRLSSGHRMAFLQGLLVSPLSMRVRIARRLDRKLSFLSYENKLRVGSIDRPDYGWPLLQGARLAEKLSYPAISAIEFGVAGGNGLVALERHAERIEKITGVRIDVYGLDSGAGLPSPIDHRDMPYLWQQGYYKMDVEALQRRLKRARLVLGDVRETVPALDCRSAPIAFVSFDLDYYSSTVSAFSIFDHERRMMTPRVACYFDDVAGSLLHAYHEYAGELLAIREFNARHENIKIDRARGAQAADQMTWSMEKLYVAHLFDHPDYSRPIGVTHQHPLKTR